MVLRSPSSPHSQARLLERTRVTNIRAARTLFVWLLVAAFVGYPLLGSLVAMTDWPSLAGSVPIRSFVLLVSLHLMSTFRENRLTTSAKLTLFFWLLYLSRLLWDLIIPGIPGADEALAFFVVGGVTSSLTAMLVPATIWDEARLARLLAIVGAMICIIALVATTFGLAESRSLFDATERLSFDTVNPITYGHVAVTTLIACFRLSGTDSDSRSRAFSGLAALAAVVLLQSSGSRGPLVALAVCVAALGLCNRRYRVIVLISIPLLVLQALWTDDSALQQRVSIVEDDPSTLQRILLQTSAIEQYFDSPIFGSAFVELQSNTYPHNPNIEAAMATGTLGLIIFVLICGLAMWRAIALLRAGWVVIPLLAIQFMVAAQFSGSLSESNQLWIVIGLMFAPLQRPLPYSIVRTHCVPARRTSAKSLK